MARRKMLFLRRPTVTEIAEQLIALGLRPEQINCHIARLITARNTPKPDHSVPIRKFGHPKTDPE